MRNFLCVLLLTLFTLTGARATVVPGSAVFVRLTGDASDARSDVYTQRLAGGDTKLVIDHTTLPKTFHGRIERALPSADGALMLLVESDVSVIRNKTTGATRLVLGSDYPMIGKEAETESFVGGCWLWARAGGIVRKIAPTKACESFEPLGWSPCGGLFLFNVSNTKTNSQTIRVFNAATGKTRILRTVNELVLARWTSDAKAILVVEQATETTARLSLVGLDGKAQRLFTRSHRVFTSAISPSGRQVAVGDTGGFYLCNKDGRSQRRLAVPSTYRMPEGDMAFSADGKRLAILSSSIGSGPYANVHEELWMIETRTFASRLLTQWDVTLGNSPGEDTTHRLLGWVPGQPNLLIMGRSCTLQGQETNWRKLWLQSADSSKPAGLLAETGPYGISMSSYGK